MSSSESNKVFFGQIQSGVSRLPRHLTHYGSAWEHYEQWGDKQTNNNIIFCVIIYMLLIFYKKNFIF